MRDLTGCTLIMFLKNGDIIFWKIVKNIESKIQKYGLYIYIYI